MNEIGLVLATAIDKLDDGQYQVTVMVVVPAGGSSQTAQDSNVWIGAAIGDSVMDASKNLRKSATKKLSWLQNDTMVIGSAAAQAGIDDIIDFMLRNREIRLSNRIIISEGKASEIFDIPAGIEKNLYSEIKGMIENTKEWSRGYVPQLIDFLSGYSSKYSGSLAGRINYLTSSNKTFSTHKESTMQLASEGKTQRIAVMSGSSVFKHDKLVGFLDDDETRGYLWIKGETGTGAVVSYEPKGSGKFVLEAQKAQSKTKPEYKDGKASVTIQVRLKGVLVENSSKMDLIDEKNVKLIEKHFEKEIIDEMKLAVKKAQKEYKTDFLGFSEAFYRHRPDDWREMEGQWQEIFTDMEVKYDVKVVLANIGEIQDPIKGGEEK